MSSLLDYAKDELNRIGMVDSGEPYNDWATKAILDLIELFASQGHSGFTAPYVANMFHRLVTFKIKDTLQYLKTKTVPHTILREKCLRMMERFGIHARILG